MYNVWSIVWSYIDSKIMSELVVNRSSKVMLAHALLSLLFSIMVSFRYVWVLLNFFVFALWLANTI